MIKSLKKIKDEIISPPKVGEIIEGTVLTRDRSSLFLDLGAKGIGIIFGREFTNAKEMLKDLKLGDKLSTKVVDLETEDGYRELSLTKAHQEMAWEELAEIKENNDILEVLIKGANKGGLICFIKGISGFLPASQLLSQHYPKVDGADPAKIASELQKLVGQKIKVRIYSVDPKEKKLILSEKAIQKEKMDQELMSYSTGDKVAGVISGVTNFGAFLKFGESLEGLIHTSEINSAEGENETNGLKIGDKVKAKVIKIENNRIYLSLK